MTKPPIRTVLFGLINTYLVPEKDGLTVIDTGIPTLVPKMLSCALQLGQPVRRILLTHGHDDHVLGLDELKKAFPQAEVLMHAADVPYLEKLGLARPTQTLSGGEQIGSLSVITAPGHSAGHLAFLDERDGTLYAGDAFVNVPGLRVCTELHPLFPMPTFGTWDTETALRTARQLAEVPGVNWLALGHGQPIPQPQKLMQKTVKLAEQQIPPAPWQLVLAHPVNRIMGGARGHL